MGSLELNCCALEEKGFMNYFGTQRFGSQLIRGYQVGAALLSHDFSRAVRLILGDLTYIECDRNNFCWNLAVQEVQQKVLMVWNNGVAEAAKEAFCLMPRLYHLERGL